MSFQNAILYYMIQSNKRIEEFRISFVFHFYAGDRKNRNDLLGFYPLPP